MTKKKSTSEKLRDKLAKKLSKNNIELDNLLEKNNMSMEQLQKAHPQTIKKFEKVVNRAIERKKEEEKIREDNKKYQAERLRKLGENTRDKKQLRKYKAYLEKEYGKEYLEDITSYKAEIERKEAFKKIHFEPYVEKYSKKEFDTFYNNVMKAFQFLAESDLRIIDSDTILEYFRGSNKNFSDNDTNEILKLMLDVSDSKREKEMINKILSERRKEYKMRNFKK